MRIAINEKTINSEGNNIINKIKELTESGHEIFYIFPDGTIPKLNINMFKYGICGISVGKNKSIVDITKENNINVYVDLPTELSNRIKDSLSVSSSTYLLTSEGDFVKQIHEISKNRKPSVEKIWNRNYTDEQLKSDFPKMSKNDMVRSKNIDPDLTALEYFGVKTSYGDYEKSIDTYSKKLETLGVKEGDSVALCLPNTPETMKLVAAINEKGAICNNIFPLSSKEEIEYCINMMGSKLAFVLDSRYKDLRSIADKTTLDKAFLVTPFESLPFLKIPYDLKQKIAGYRPKDSGYGMFDDFQKIEGTDFVKPEYKENRITSIQYTSGTTGKPKAVILTDDTFNARAHQYEQVDVGLEKGVRFLQCLPICGKAYGEFTMHLGLTNGANNVLVPKFTSDELPKLIQKNDVQGLTMPPIAWLHVIDMPEFKKLDLSNFKLATIGGDGSIPKFIQMIQRGLESQGFKGQAILGSGGTELGVTFSTNTKDVNQMGTSGPIMKGNNCHIINDDGTECGYNEKGIVYYDSVSPCLGYANKDKQLVQNDYGIDLGDYGLINERGLLTICGRRDDIIQINGEKISPMDLEVDINECPYVKYGYVVKLQEASKKIRICYTTYNDYPGIDIDEEVMSFVPKKLQTEVEICRLSYIPETPGLKVDRARLANNISDLRYNYAPSKRMKRKNIK